MNNKHQVYILKTPWKISIEKAKPQSEYKSNFISVKKQLKLLKQKSLKNIMT
jgi:hypothetical protein